MRSASSGAGGGGQRRRGSHCQPVGRAVEHRREKVGLAGEVAVHARRVDAGRGADFFDARVVIAVPVEYLHGLVDQQLTLGCHRQAAYRTCACVCVPSVGRDGGRQCRAQDRFARRLQKRVEPARREGGAVCADAPHHAQRRRPQCRGVDGREFGAQFPQGARHALGDVNEDVADSRAILGLEVPALPAV